MSAAPIFLLEESIHDFHAEQIAEFGGSPGLRDANGLAAAIASALNTHLYNPDATLFDIAAAYAYHISMGQTFLDGNKRTALQAALTFLVVNGYDVEIADEDLYECVIRLHKGQEQKAAFAARLRACAAPLTQ